MSVRPRKLLILLPNLRGGGAERVMLTVARSLDRAAFATTVAVIDGRAPAFLSDLSSEIRFVDLGCNRVRESLVTLVRFIRRERPDIILSAAGHLNVALALVRPLLPGTPRLIAREAGVISDTFATQGYAWLWRFLYRRLYRRFDRIICQSEQMRAEVVQGGFADQAATVVVNNPVDLPRIVRHSAEALPSPEALEWFSAPNTVRLVAAGRLAREKGFDILVDAVAQLRDVNVRLVILGEGPERSALERQIVSLGLASRIQLLGFQRNPFAFFSRSHAFVLSSRTEAFSNVVLEALASGTSVIALPARGGINELLSGKPNSVIASEVSADALAAAIRRFDFGRSPLGARAALARHAPEVVASEYARILSSSSLHRDG